MRRVSERVLNPRIIGRRASYGAVAATLACLVALAVVGSAAALPKEPLDKADFIPFANCPTASAAVCIVSDTTAGEFKLGSKTVPIPEGTDIRLQGGLATESFAGQTLIPPLEGPTLSETPLALPGGLTGVPGLGGDVYAVAELAGPVEVNRANLALSLTPAVTLRLKVHLMNELLGENCYIGSEAEPIVLHLTVGRTSPPSPTEPLEGHRSPVEYKDKKRISYIPNSTLVDNTFPVPAATGCGGTLSAIVNPIVNLDAGLPAKAGESRVVMTSSLQETISKWAAKYRPKVKKPRKEKIA